MIYRAAILAAIMAIPLFSFPVSATPDPQETVEDATACLGATVAKAVWDEPRGIVDFDSENLGDCVIWHFWHQRGLQAGNGSVPYYYYKVQQGFVVCC